MQRRGLLLRQPLGCPSIPHEEEAASPPPDLGALRQKWGPHSLTETEREQLSSGLTVQKQERDGPTGSGLVAFEVDAPPSFILEFLEKFEKYPEMIPVVRHAELLSRTPSGKGMLARLNYKISRFWLNLTVVHRVDRADSTIRFDLDEACSKLVLHEAFGFWELEQAPGDDPNRTRVWLRASLHASGLVPRWIIEYAAVRALRRATSWMKPYAERAWLEK